MSTLFNILSGHVGYGQIGHSTIGFWDSLQPSPLCRRSLEGWQILGAHAPSSVVVRFNVPCEIFAFLNASANIDRANPVDCWISGNYVGTLELPSDFAESVVVPSGELTLRSLPRSGGNHGRHVVWAIRPASRPTRHARMAIIAVACYPHHDYTKVIDTFSRSAYKNGLWITAFGIGSEYVSHYHTKVEKMLQWMSGLPPEVDRIVYVDAKDSFFCADSESILKSFEAFDSDIVVSAEACCYPERSPSWTSLFEMGHRGRNWICAGAFMGKRAAMQTALEKLAELHDKLQLDDPSVRSVRPWWNHTNNDQWYWQAAHLLGLFPLKLDDRFSLFASVCCERHYQLVNNPVFSLEAGKILDKTSGQYPKVIHFSDAYRACMDQWAGYLGVG